MVRAGLEAIYVSGWQVAADANSSSMTYPDQSLYPADSVPRLVRRINQALLRADQIEHAEGGVKHHWMAPLVADAEAGFGGPLNAFELMKGMIEAGAAGVHFEDQLSSEKKCGHLGGKVLVPDGPIRAHADRRAPGGRRDGRPDVAHRAHRRRQREAPDLRRRPARPARSARASARPRGSTGSTAASRWRSRAASPTRPTPTPSGARPRRRIFARRGSSPTASTPSSRKAAGLQLLAVVQLEEAPGRRDDRQVPARAGRDGLQVPVRHAGRLPRAEPRDVRAGEGLPRRRHGRVLVACSRPSSRAEAAGYTATKHQREVGTGYFDEVAQVISGGDVVRRVGAEGVDRRRSSFYEAPRLQRRLRAAR